MKSFDAHKAALAMSFIGTSLLAAPTLATATVIYNEATSGDLRGDQSTSTLVGSFVAGDNTILGRDSILTDIGSQGDTFGLTLLVGQRIESISVSIGNNTNTNDQFGLTVFQSPFAQVSQISPIKGAVGTFSFSPFASQSAGQYNFSTQFVTGTQPANGFDWRWDIRVSAIPEPSQAGLLFAGLAALVWVARKRRVG